MKVLGMVRFPLMDAGLLSDVIKEHEVTKVKVVKFDNVSFIFFCGQRTDKQAVHVEVSVRALPCPLMY